jgi:hypothetical protein
MAIRKSQPLRFSAQGLSDALDGTEVFEGACSTLQNLIPDSGTKGIWVCRPASVKAVDLTVTGGFSSPGFVSAGYILGSRFYGMVASALTPGFDQPFCYDLVAGSFITISGITGLNVPASPSTGGDWEPPTMALVGTKLIVTHPGFNYSAGNAFGWFETANPSAISWQAGNTTGVLTLPARATAVAQFGGRAWFLVNPITGQPTAYFTDILSLNITNAGQALTFDDNVQLTAAVGLPLENQLGGIIQSLIVFKGATNMYQITGDYSLSTLAKNAMNVATGTKAPRSICVTPKGIVFISPDGARVIDFNARVSDPIGEEGSGVNNPFLNALYPSRIAAAANANTVRITAQDGSAPGTPTYEYWYDLVKLKWSGPHTFPTDLAIPYNNTFIIVPKAVRASLWQSDVINTSLSTFVENGSAMTCSMQTSLLPDITAMAESCVIETAIEMVLPLPPSTISVTALNEDYSAIIPAVALGASGAGPSYWGVAIWGTALWYGSSIRLKSVRVPWTQPIVFKRMALNITFTAAANVRIGATSMRYQQLGYLQQ